MGKQKRVEALTGHLLKPYFRYIMSAEIFMSPVDVEGNKLGKRMFDEFKGWDPVLAQPTVQVKLAENPKIANAFMKITYSTMLFDHRERLGKPIRLQRLQVSNSDAPHASLCKGS